MTHFFNFPVEQKYFPAHKVSKQPELLVSYKVIGQDIKVDNLVFPFHIIGAIRDINRLLEEIEEAAKTHYQDVIQAPEAEYPKEEIQERDLY